VSKKTGKPGYALPARTVRAGVCDLPKVKWGECPNQAFVPVDDVAVIGHLRVATSWGCTHSREPNLLVPGGRLRQEHLEEDVLGSLPRAGRWVFPPRSSGHGRERRSVCSSHRTGPRCDPRKMGCHLITEDDCPAPRLSWIPTTGLFPKNQKGHDIDREDDFGQPESTDIPIQHGHTAAGRIGVPLMIKLRPMADDQQWAYPGRHARKNRPQRQFEKGSHREGESRRITVIERSSCRAYRQQ